MAARVRHQRPDRVRPDPADRHTVLLCDRAAAPGLRPRLRHRRTAVSQREAHRLQEEEEERLQEEPRFRHFMLGARQHVTVLRIDRIEHDVSEQVLSRAVGLV